MKRSIVYTVLWLMVTVYGIWGLFYSDYNKEKPYNVRVVQIYLPQGGYKTSTNPVLVYELPDGRIKDIRISYATLSQIKEGDQLTFMFSDAKINQNVIKNIFYIFLPIILLSISFACIIVTLLYLGIKYGCASS